MNLILVIIQIVHLLGALAWVGGAFLFDFVVLPFNKKVPLESQRVSGFFMSERLGPFFGVAGGITIVFGIARGIVGGQISGFDSFQTPYGIMWIAALVLSIGMALWGARILGPAALRLYANEALWAPGSDGNPQPALIEEYQKLKTLLKIDVSLFLVIIVGMVVMAMVL